MSYHPPFFFNTQQLSQSQQTSPSQQQLQQPPTLVQTSPSVASYQLPLPAVAPWHQPQQQTVYRSDTGTRYVYDNANQTSVSANPTAISVNPMSHLSMTDSLQTTPNRQTVGNVSSSVISTLLPMASGDISLSTPVSKSVHPNVSTSPKEEEMFYLTIPQSHMNRAEVKSLLSESEAKKELSPVKSEPTDVPVQEQEETVESSTISTTSPILDPSVVPEGQGLVDG